jgi:hypothetical protein
MTVNLRTVLRWLDEQRIHDEAMCWILGSDTVEPVTHVTWTEDGHMILESLPPWSEPIPTALRYEEVCDILLEHYAGGGSLKWTKQPDTIYRGSYVVDPKESVFFIFLPSNIRFVDSHSEKIEQKRQQAIQLTRQIEESQKWPTSM